MRLLVSRAFLSETCFFPDSFWARAKAGSAGLAHCTTMDALERTVVVAGIRGLRGQPGVGADGIGEEAIAEFFAFDCGQARNCCHSLSHEAPPDGPLAPQVLSVRIAGAVVYVEFADPSGVHRALQKDGTESGGHLLHITPARPVGAAKSLGGVQLPPAGQLGPRGDWFQADKVADEGGVAGVGSFAGMPSGDKSRGAQVCRFGLTVHWPRCHGRSDTILIAGTRAGRWNDVARPGVRPSICWAADSFRGGIPAVPRGAFCAA